MPSSRRSRPSRCCPTTRRSRSPRSSPPSSPPAPLERDARPPAPRARAGPRSRPPACSRSPCPPSTAAPTSRPRRSPRCSGCSPPATRASPRSRTATSSTSTRCATRARVSSRRFFFGEVLAGKRFGNAQSEVGTKHVRDIRTTLTPAGNGRLDAQRHQGLQHRRALRRLDPGARPQDRWPTPAPARCTWPGSSATPPASRVIDDWNGMGQRTTASGTVRLDQRRRDRRPDHAVPPHLRGPADLRRVRAVAARRDRRRHRPRRARPRPRSSSAPRAGPTRSRRGPRRRRPAGRAARSARWSSRCGPPRRCCARPARAVDAADADLTDDSAATREPGRGRRRAPRRTRVRRGVAAGSSRWPAPARPSTRST